MFICSFKTENIKYSFPFKLIYKQQTNLWENKQSVCFGWSAVPDTVQVKLLGTVVLLHISFFITVTRILNTLIITVVVVCGFKSCCILTMTNLWHHQRREVANKISRKKVNKLFCNGKYSTCILYWRWTLPGGELGWATNADELILGFRGFVMQFFCTIQICAYKCLTGFYFPLHMQMFATRKPYPKEQ